MPALASLAHARPCCLLSDSAPSPLPSLCLPVQVITSLEWILEQGSANCSTQAKSSQLSLYFTQELSMFSVSLND